ncbi:glycosyltransferase [uncultured Pseudodesulfovibrio sp.]|uniref:glycosyltransferase n=1 Tax=uncultured Pseudodesulfovibrio sp. TaxID=2035858 RepID=UPI0029C94AC4|nr:glycosyltransferase [uncultured Pseudodesulfovibrio sp.]
MHIAFVNSTRKWGGVKTWTVDYARELLARGHHVSAHVRQDVFLDRLREEGVDAHKAGFGFDFNPVSIVRLMAAFSRNRPDVVICNIKKDMNIGGMAAKLLGIPVIQRVGMPRDMEDDKGVAFLLKTIRPWMLCPSRSVAAGIRRYMPYFPEERIKVIHNAKRPAERITPVRTGPLRLVSTSQVNQEKGHEFVLEALESFPAGSFRYDVVGTGKYLETLRERHAALAERGDLVWHGFSVDVASHLAESDIFLLPSMSEGMPNALLEAMSAGLIPVTRDIGGVREIWPDAFDWLMLPTESGAEAVRVVLAKLLDMDRTQLDALKEASLETCRSTFNLPKKIDEFERWVRDEVVGG